MPTVLRSGPYRFFFYASDRHEAPHVHVERDNDQAKFWLQPIAFQSSAGFRRRELMDIYQLISKHQELLLKGWHDYFND
jgi:hypothetical protein